MFVALRRYLPVTYKLIANDRITEQVDTFKFLGCHLSYISELGVDKKVEKFNNVWMYQEKINGKVRDVIQC